MKLYHSSFSIIENPDLKHGRTNADFGQGFYLSYDREFVLRWSKRHLGKKTYINEYELDTRGLKICHFERNIEWFSYIAPQMHAMAALAMTWAAREIDGESCFVGYLLKDNVVIYIFQHSKSIISCAAITRRNIVSG